MENVGKWAIALALCGMACAKGGAAEQGNASIGPLDAGAPPDSGPGPTDAGPPDAGPPDAGPIDAGPADAGPADAGPRFGGPGPWPTTNATYGSAEGIDEMPVVAVSTDETQNLWVATNSALYLLRPGDKMFTRFDETDGLHLPGFPAAECDDAQGTLRPCPAGDADAPGISEMVGGGAGQGYAGEVFVGYYGHHDWSRLDDGTWTDPWRHSGKLDRVRLKTDGTGRLSLEVIRFDMVSNNSVEFWHNKTVYKMVYDHFIHPHELYVGTDHGVTKFSPDEWKANDPPPHQWFLAENNSQVWRSDHLHPQACYHKPCTDESGLRLSDWRGLAIDGTGDLWVAGRYAAGLISWVADNSVWYNRGGGSFIESYGDPYSGNCSGSRPVFCAPLEGDPVNLSAVTVAKDGTIWIGSGILFNEAGDVNYGIAAHVPRKGFTYYDPVRDAGLPDANVRDMLALPDGRLVLASPNSGLSIWDPATGKHVAVRAGQGIPDDRILRLQLDTMVDPPALQVATRGGAAVLRVLP